MYWKNISQAMADLAQGDIKGNEVHFMGILINSINEIVSSSNKKIRPDRVWTLHTVHGSRVKVHNSDPNIGEIMRKSFQDKTDGLIGLSIKRRQDVNIYTQITEEKYSMYKRGWPYCESELIALVRDPAGNIIAVINIESNDPDDFLNGDEDDPKLKSELNQLMITASECLNVILERENMLKVIDRNEKTISKIYEQPLNAKANVKSFIDTSFLRLNTKVHILKGGLYISNKDVMPGGASEINEDCYKLSGQNVDFSIFESGEIPTELFANVEKHNFTRNPRMCSIDKFSSIFGKNNCEMFFSGSNTRSVYIQHHTVSVGADSSDVKILLIVLLEDELSGTQSTNLIKSYDLFSHISQEYVKNSISRQKEIKLNIYSRLNEVGANSYDITNTLSLIAEDVNTSTNSSFVLIYLLASQRPSHEQDRFFLAGFSRSAPETDGINLPIKESLIGEAFKDENTVVYIEDYYQQDTRTKLLDEFIRSSSITDPALFISKLYDTSSSEPFGAIVTFSDSSQDLKERNRNIRLLLLYSKIGSELIHNKSRQIWNDIVKIGFNVFIDSSFDEREFKSVNESIENYQLKLNTYASRYFEPFTQKVVFGIYVNKSNIYELASTNGLGVIEEDTPLPSFEKGKGLTGCVVTQENGELFVPFVDRLDDSTSDFHTDPTCKMFWNTLVGGNSKRFFYGKEVVVGFNSYIIVVIGQQPKDYFPPAMYMLLSELMASIKPSFIKNNYKYNKHNYESETDSIRYLKEVFLRDYGKFLNHDERDKIESLFIKTISDCEKSYDKNKKRSFTDISSIVKTNAKSIAELAKHGSGIAVSSDRIIQLVSKYLSSMY